MGKGNIQLDNRQKKNFPPVFIIRVTDAVDV